MPGLLDEEPDDQHSPEWLAWHQRQSASDEYDPENDPFIDPRWARERRRAMQEQKEQDIS